MDGPYIDTGTQYQQGMPYVGQKPLFMHSENGDSRGRCPCEARKLFRCVLKHLVYERSAAYLWQCLWYPMAENALSALLPIRESKRWGD